MIEPKYDEDTGEIKSYVNFIVLILKIMKTKMKLLINLRSGVYDKIRKNSNS